MKNWSIAIIGAGQLGSRHLQGLKKAPTSMNITVFDTCADSLHIAEQRYHEVPDNPLIKGILFTTRFEELPDYIDLAIISTSSGPRFRVTSNLLENRIVKNILFEKFLFPKLSEYALMSKLLSDRGINAKVNCPRRMFDHYKRLSTSINNSFPIKMEVIGIDWGLGCNSIHFIDLFALLSGTSEMKCDFSAVEKKIIPSKRKGYVEFLGTVEVTSSRGDKLMLSSLKDYSGDSVIRITAGDDYYEFFESKSLMIQNGEDKAIRAMYQSELTEITATEILVSRDSPLTSFEESSLLHIAFLKEAVSFYNAIVGSNGDSCPIT
jgi:hypothetical protein